MEKFRKCGHLSCYECYPDSTFAAAKKEAARKAKAAKKGGKKRRSV